MSKKHGRYEIETQTGVETNKGLDWTERNNNTLTRRRYPHPTLGCMHERVASRNVRYWSVCTLVALIARVESSVAVDVRDARKGRIRHKKQVGRI